MGPTDLVYRDAKIATATGAANASTTATAAASGAGKRNVAFGVLISFQGGATGAVTATVNDGAGLLFNIQMPASAVSPVALTFPRAVIGTENTAMTVVVPALGVGIVSSVVLFYRQTAV